MVSDTLIKFTSFSSVSYTQNFFIRFAYFYLKGRVIKREREETHTHTDQPSIAGSLLKWSQQSELG